MYLHEDRDNLKSIIEQVSNENGRTLIVLEKDYYVTLILKLLAEQLPNCVFKGGTSLSKGFRAINRFSSEELGMSISNWEDIQSDRDYNAYHFSYVSVFGLEDDRLPQSVKLETALGSYSFPTQIVEIGNYIGDYLVKIFDEFG